MVRNRIVQHLPTLPFITSSGQLHLWRKGRRPLNRDWSFLRSVGPRIECDSSSFCGLSSSSEKTDHTLSLFTERSGSGFAAGSIRAEEVTNAGLEEIYVPEWTVTKGIVCWGRRHKENEELRVPIAESTGGSSVGRPTVLVFPLEAFVRGHFEAKLLPLRGIYRFLNKSVPEPRSCTRVANFVVVLLVRATIFMGEHERLVGVSGNLMSPGLGLAEIVADFTGVCYRERKGMRGLGAGMTQGQAGRCLTDLEAYIPSAKVDFNSAVCDLCDLDFPLLQELSNKKDASTWDVMDLLRLDDTVAEALGMPDLRNLNVDVLPRSYTSRVAVGVWPSWILSGLGLESATYCVAVSRAGVGPLSGKGPRVIVSADVSILPQSVFVRGGATGAALKGSITSLKCVLTQEHLDAICAKYFVPEEVHPQLPSSNATMHERPAGKVGMYTRFFDYANYRIPFSTFFVSVLTHFRIPFSQLSVFGSAKVSHFEILCRVCNIDPSVGLFRYFYTYNYKNGWFGFTKRPNVRACYSKNLDSVKNWNDHFFWVDEFVVPANARFGWFSGTNIVKDRAPAPSEYNVEHVNTLIAQASPFLRFPGEFLCWVGISRNYLLSKDTYPHFEYKNGEEMDLNAFIRTADPRKVRIVERARTENERPIVTVAKHLTVTLLPTSVVRSSRELSASVEREFVGDASVGDGGDHGFDSVGGQDNVEPIVPITDHVETETPRPKRTKKKRVTRGSEKTSSASHPPKRLRADYGTTGGSATGALPLEEGRDHTNSVTGPSLRTVGPSVRFVVLSDSSHHSATNSAGPEGDSFVRSIVPVMTEATAVTTIATTVAIPADVGKDKSVPHPSVFGSSSSSEKTDRTLSLFTGRSGSGFAAGSIRAEDVTNASLEEIYVPEWTVTKGFELNDGRSCANMIDHFSPPAFFKTVHGMEHEQLFAEFNVSAVRNLSLIFEVRMRAEYNILEKKKWKSLAEEKDSLLGAKDKEIEELRSQLLKAKEESVLVAQLRSRVSSLEAVEGSL
ncbi:hypothetical protein Tco_1054998 [Tanacetum coccineum]|uniref:Transposase (putative) gypsy type domain-containing protein n=1 Tax=Tanacetum coccineum TaxID=301880 RepID=A0ABQ5GYD3_9ASTR